MTTNVVASVGTDHHPFTRLVDWMDAVSEHHPEWQVFVQHGATPPPRRADGASLLPLDELRGRFAAAAVVITHGGPATITDAVESGHRPLVVPRRPELGEHVDDHQVRFARRMAMQGRITLVQDQQHLAEVIETSTRVGEDIARSRQEEVTNSVIRFAAEVSRLQPRPPRGA